MIWKRLLKRTVRVLVRLVVALVVIVITAIVAQAFLARRMPELMPWQREIPDHEFRAQDADSQFGFADYLELERRLFDEIDEIDLNGAELGNLSPLIRYFDGGVSDSRTYAVNWNRTVELAAATPEPTGAALLLHGLSDSPYSLRSIASLLSDQGYAVVALRIPGHGVVPAGLLEVSWLDWVAAVGIAARHVEELAGDGAFVIAGYSNGGALALLHTLDAIEDDTLRVPDRLLLFSPAVGITAFARASSWHKLVSWIPYFEKARWLSIEPEFDPYKFNSFPQNAGEQCWKLTCELQARLERKQTMERFPPVLAFQSVVDSTILGEDVLTKLCDRLPENGSELVVFDVNRNVNLDGFYAQDRAAVIERLERRAGAGFRLSVLTNESELSRRVVLRSRAAGAADPEDQPLDAEWPRQVYSLAHVAIPFPADDPIYGTEVPEWSAGPVNLGTLALRGETHVLTIPATLLMRLRSNPFHGFMVARISESLPRKGAR